MSRDILDNEVLDVNGHPLVVGEFYILKKKNRKISDKSSVDRDRREYIHNPDGSVTIYDHSYDFILHYDGTNDPYYNISKENFVRYLGKSTTSQQLSFVAYQPAQKHYIILKTKDFMKYKRGKSNKSNENKLTLMPENLKSLTPYLDKTAFDEKGFYNIRKQSLEGIDYASDYVPSNYVRNDEDDTDDELDHINNDLDEKEQYINDHIYDPVPKVEDEIRYMDLQNIEDDWNDVGEGRRKKQQLYKKQKTKKQKKQKTKKQKNKKNKKQKTKNKNKKII